jgi:large subunit ribosomal protein L24
MHVKKDDNVIILTGKDKNKTGKILKSIPKTGRVIVEGTNIVTKHQKPSYGSPDGGIVKKEAPIHISNVLLYCDKCEKGVRTRMKLSETSEKKIRVCVKCGYEFDKS